MLVRIVSVLCELSPQDLSWRILQALTKGHNKTSDSFTYAMASGTPFVIKLYAGSVQHSHLHQECPEI